MSTLSTCSYYSLSHEEYDYLKWCIYYLLYQQSANLKQDFMILEFIFLRNIPKLAAPCRIASRPGRHDIFLYRAIVDSLSGPLPSSKGGSGY